MLDFLVEAAPAPSDNAIATISANSRFSGVTVRQLDPALAEAKNLPLAWSLGVSIDKDARVTSTQWDSPAFNAGIVPGSKIVAVNGAAYDGDGMKAAITAAKDGAPLELLIQRGSRYQTVALDYRGGLRWPWLERAAPGTAPTGLDRLLMPRRPMGKAK